MNLPEGWPTEEMVEAAYDEATELTNVHEPIFKAMFKAALAAAPTPSAQEDEPCDSELESVLIPLIYKRLPPKAIEQLTYTAWKDGIDIECVGAPMKALIREVISVYTRSADDKLRKAAEEALPVLLDVCNWFYNKRLPEREVRAIGNLRAALNSNPTPSDTDKPSPA